MEQHDRTINPEWAWQAYQPSLEQPWNRRAVSHLFRRAAICAGPQLISQACAQTPLQVVGQLLGGPSDSQKMFDDQQQLAQTLLATGNAKRLSAWWIYTLLATRHPLIERMTLFWHGHFASSAEKVGDGAMYRQNQLLRRYALGNFRDLVHQIARDPAMLVYLDSATNRRSHPNENFARELMELFCLGEGNYSETDVQELARCFTGWEVKQDRFRFNRYQHDSGNKRLFGRESQFADDEAIDWVLQQPNATNFVVSKLYRLFIRDEPEPSPDLLQPLADQLRASNWNIGPTVERMLTSQLFFSKYAIGKKVRSPVELLIGLLRALEGTANSEQLAVELRRLGQDLFYPPNVKGWDGGRTWINSSTVLGRSNAVGKLIRDEKTRFGSQKLAEYVVEQLKLQTPHAFLDFLAETWLAVPLRSSVREQLLSGLSNSNDAARWTVEVVQGVASLPESQLG